ncbi:hypothetical protein TSUD_346520 [Trifolium subterraneum]|nr:hypothetical protein TSUD_346520 [Trifolium subterraneum]
MKCFLPCFSSSSSKRQKHFSQPVNTAPQPTLQNTNLQESIHWISESKIENEDQSQCINNNTDDDLETKEKALKEEKTTLQDNHEEEQECSESLFSVSIGCTKPVSAEENDDEIEVNSTPIKLRSAKDVSGSSPIVPLQEPKPESNEAKEEEERPMNEPLLNKYRYQDCSDDGYDDINLNEESSESSLFSISTDYKRKPISVSSIQKELVDHNEVTSIMVEPQEEQESEGNNIVEKDENICSSVLNPIGNVSQRKTKTTLLHSIKKDKENINCNQPEPSLNLKLSLSSNKKINETEKGKEFEVNTSLSTWLVESENKYDTPKRCDVEDRPILGALTIEEIRKYSSNISRTSSRTHSPEEAPIIGSVGSYWNHSEQRKSSKSNKYEKDGKRERSSTTVKTRLEPAFEAASHCCSINKD